MERNQILVRIVLKRWFLVFDFRLCTHVSMGRSGAVADHHWQTRCALRSRKSPATPTHTSPCPHRKHLVLIFGKLLGGGLSGKGEERFGGMVHNPSCFGSAAPPRPPQANSTPAPHLTPPFLAAVSLTEHAPLNTISSSFNLQGYRHTRYRTPTSTNTGYQTATPQMKFDANLDPSAMSKC
eukprot:3666900-Rhodomonas_salina.2